MSHVRRSSLSHLDRPLSGSMKHTVTDLLLKVICSDTDINYQPKRCFADMERKMDISTLQKQCNALLVVLCYGV